VWPGGIGHGWAAFLGGHCFITAAVGNAQVDFKKQAEEISPVVVEAAEGRGDLYYLKMYLPVVPLEERQLHRH